MCVFCDIIEGKIPSYKIYEDEQVIAILDIAEASKGHTLVITKKHYESFMDVDKKTLEHLIGVVQDLAKHIEAKTDCKGLNILTNVNEVSGQSVKHLHFHIIPRYDEHDHLNVGFIQHEVTDLEEVYELLKTK